MSMAQVQRLAARITREIAGGKNLQDVLAQAHSRYADWDAADQGALRDLVYGVQRFSGSLRWMLSQLANRRISHADLETLLLVALYQLSHTQAAPYAVVNEAVRSAVRIDKKLGGFANAVLRRFLKERETLNRAVCQNEVAYYNFPEWWLGYLKTHYPQQWQEVAASAAMHPPLTVRVNRRHTDAAGYLKSLRDNGLDGEALDDYTAMVHQAVHVNRLPGFADGVVSVQDWGAQRAAALLNPQCGERVLDACAAPGGKTGHLLEWADCAVDALDISAERLQRVGSNLKRLKLQAASLRCADAGSLTSWYDGNPYDAVLADLPCTASGVVKRNPDIKWLRRPEDGANTAAQQAVLLDALWQTVKRGGRMLLATCSVFAEENTHQLNHFLQRHHDAECTESHILLPNAQRDGFFYALIRKH